jgi:zinc protease
MGGIKIMNNRTGYQMHNNPIDFPTDPAEYSAFPGDDDIMRRELPNGIIVLARQNFNSPSVVINGYIQTGSLADPDEKLGLSSFTASALMRGTASRSFQAIYDSLESVAASLGFNGGTHTTGFAGRSLAEDLDMLLELLAETLRMPEFPGEQVEKLRAQILTGLAIRAQDTGEMASLTFDEIAYQGHPYSRYEDGHPQTVRGISREDLDEFHRVQYGPKGMVIVVVGAVDPEESYEKVARILGDWRNPEQREMPDLPEVKKLEGIVRREVNIPGKSQADIILGTVGPPRRSPDFLASSLGNNILGQFGMYGRIGEAVRETAGMAYYAYSSLSGGPGPGPWYVSAGVDPQNVEKAIELVREEISKFTAEGVSEEELNDSKANYVGRLPLSLESNGGVASALLSLERYQLGLDYYRRYPGLVAAVTREEVLETAKRYLDSDRLAVAIAGTFPSQKGDV